MEAAFPIPASSDPSQARTRFPPAMKRWSSDASSNGDENPRSPSDCQLDRSHSATQQPVSDPARKIHYASALITHIRSALYYIANNSEDKEFEELLHQMLYNIIRSEYDEKALTFAFNRMKRLFEDSKRTRYDVMLMNDIALIQQCRNNWRGANARYFSNVDAWQHSNEILADIQDVLVEVATRWNLVIIPKDMPFNISSMPNLVHTMVPETPLDQ